MDHYNEQMIKKQTEPKDIVIRIIVIAAALALVLLSIYAALMFGFIPLMLVGAGVIYLAYLLLSGTFVEYEYIVTNNDLDIDKITGKRKRKRLVTVKLNTVKQWGEYTGKEGSKDVTATVIASDATGYESWYLIADHEKLGKIMVIFTPSKTTITNVNFGVPYGVKKKLNFQEDEESIDEEETE